MEITGGRKQRNEGAALPAVPMNFPC